MPFSDVSLGRRGETPEELRRRPAKAVVYLAAMGERGPIGHVRVRKDDAARVLTAVVWWVDDAEQQCRERVTANIERLLGLWVWDGWTARVETSSEPRPDVVWDVELQRYVPKATSEARAKSLRP